jgi:hypothetical protein
MAKGKERLAIGSIRNRKLSSVVALGRFDGKNLSFAPSGGLQLLRRRG